MLRLCSIAFCVLASIYEWYFNYVQCTFACMLRLKDCLTSDHQNIYIYIMAMIDRHTTTSFLVCTSDTSIDVHATYYKDASMYIHVHPCTFMYIYVYIHLASIHYPYHWCITVIFSVQSMMNSVK